jgi:hypothetical protein
MASAEASIEENVRQLGFVLLFGAIAGGLVLAWLGQRDLRLAGVADAEPSPISCRELAERGPGANAHVRLSGFRLLVESFVIEQWKINRDASEFTEGLGRTGEHESWSKAWIPALPADDPHVARLDAAPEARSVPPPDHVRVLVQTAGGSQRALDDLAQERELVGTVINEIESLHTGVTKLLQDAYPRVPIERCWILELGRVPEPAGGAWGRLLGGLALVAAGVGGLLFWHRVQRRAATRAAERSQARRERERARRARPAN